MVHFRTLESPREACIWRREFAMPADEKLDTTHLEAGMYLTQPPMRKLRLTYMPYTSVYLCERSPGAGLRVYDFLVAAANVPVSDSHRQYILQNVGGCRFLGYSPEQITGWDILKVLQNSITEHEHHTPGGELALASNIIETWKHPAGSWNRPGHPLEWLNEWERRRRL